MYAFSCLPHLHTRQIETCAALSPCIFHIARKRGKMHRLTEERGSILLARSVTHLPEMHCSKVFFLVLVLQDHNQLLSWFCRDHDKNFVVVCPFLGVFRHSSLPIDKYSQKLNTQLSPLLRGTQMLRSFDHRRIRHVVGVRFL